MRRITLPAKTYMSSDNFTPIVLVQKVRFDGYNYINLKQ